MTEALAAGLPPTIRLLRRPAECNSSKTPLRISYDGASDDSMAQMDSIMLRASLSKQSGLVLNF